jgi:DNA modification methylase
MIPFAELDAHNSHYATFPAELVRRCVLAGSRPADLVLDPFAGAGTIGKVCEELSRGWIGIDLQADYGGIARRRIAQMGFMF